jgi:ATP-dependent protease HslVU (ClpYQ) peptidase subunit
MDQKDRYVLKNEKLTEQKREAVRKKLSIICKKDENIDEILKSLEAYCLIVVNSH